MELYYSFSVLIVLASIFAYINYRFLKLPSTIGIMVIAITVSIVLVFFGETLFPKTFNRLHQLMTSIDFTEVLMGAMLNFLLFAGGIHVNIDDLKEQLRPIVIFFYSWRCDFYFRGGNWHVLFNAVNWSTNSVHILLGFWSINFSNRPCCGFKYSKTSQSF